MPTKHPNPFVVIVFLVAIGVVVFVFVVVVLSKRCDYMYHSVVWALKRDNKAF